MHDVLKHIFVCVTFHWETLSLTLLQGTTDVLASYPVNMTAKMVSNEPEKVSRVLYTWAEDGRYKACTLIDGNRAALNRTRVNRVYPTSRTCDAD